MADQLKKLYRVRTIFSSFFLQQKYSIPNSWYNFSREEPLIAPVIASVVLYWTDSIFLENASLEGWSQITSAQSRSGLNDSLLKETDTFVCLINFIIYVFIDDNLLSRVRPGCFWFELSVISELLKKSGGCVVTFSSLEKIISCACLVRSGLNDIFHWYAQSCIFNRSLLSIEVGVFTQFAMLNKEV